MTDLGIVDIDDPADPRLDDYRQLTDVALRQRVETSSAGADAPHGIFVAEGKQVVRRLLRSTLAARSIVTIPSRLDALWDDLTRDRPSGVPVYRCEPAVLNEVAGFDFHRGVLAIGVRPAPIALDSVVGAARCIAVLEAINDHENIGAIARSALALGIDAMVLSPQCADPWYRRSLRVSMGAVLDLPIVTAVDWPLVLDELASHGFAVVALTPDDAAPTIDGVARELGTDRPVAIVLGAEGPGLSEAALAHTTHQARIPMRESRVGLDSLNVAAAAAIAFSRFGSVTW